jgi:hypothetical protein
MGVKYEKAINELLKNKFAKDIKVSILKQRRGDLAFNINNNEFGIEIKLNDQSQVGSTTVNNILTNPSLFKNIPSSEIILNEINKQKKIFNSFINVAKSFGATINEKGALKLKNKEDWKLIKQKWGKAVPRISFELDQTACNGTLL